MLKVTDLTFQYANHGEFVLDVPSWECAKGERVAIIGRSGSGKTSFLKCLAGLLQPNSGAIHWLDERIQGADERLVPGNDKIKLVHQNFDQDPHLKVVENLRKYILSLDDEERASKINNWLQQLNIEELEQRKTLLLSGGQLQRVALAQTLLAEPEVMLMDEPFSNLDPIHKSDFIPALRSLFEDEEVTTIAVLHDPADALRIADRVVVFKDGQIVEEGSASELYHQPKTLETVQLFGWANILTVEEDRAYFNHELQKPLVEGKRWFRPNERSTGDLKVDFVIERELPVSGFSLVEVRVSEKLLLLAK